MIPRLYDLSVDALLIFAPLLLAVMLAAAFSPLLLNGWLFSSQALMPQFSCINPVSGIARMFFSNLSPALRLVDLGGEGFASPPLRTLKPRPSGRGGACSGLKAGVSNR